MTVYANLVDGKVLGVCDRLPTNWNGILNFDVKASLDNEVMKENGFVMIVRDNTTYDPSTHKMSDFPTYSVNNGQVIEHRELIKIN